jgi:hypothetical protein
VLHSINPFEKGALRHKLSTHPAPGIESPDHLYVQRLALALRLRNAVDACQDPRKRILNRPYYLSQLPNVLFDSNVTEKGLARFAFRECLNFSAIGVCTVVEAPFSKKCGVASLTSGTEDPSLGRWNRQRQ